MVRLLYNTYLSDICPLLLEKAKSIKKIACSDHHRRLAVGKSNIKTCALNVIFGLYFCNQQNSTVPLITLCIMKK